MDVVSAGPLRVASLRWRGQRAGEVLTVVAKATFHLQPGACVLANEQEDPNEQENHWDDDEKRSLYSPTDLVPWKPRPEVTLVGNAFAPHGEPVSRLVARMIVGSADKSIVVHGERAFSHEGALREGARFTRMPLRWERAAGGPETKNPVGIAHAMDARGWMPLPNLEPFGAGVTRADQHIEPACFAPIAADWPSRRERISLARGGGFTPSEPVSDAFDPLYFMSAPPDQHLDELRANERIVLENLHPEHPRLVTSLPGYEPRAFVDRGRAGVSELPMTADTLWIDTDRSICTLTFRAQLAVDDRAEGRVVIAMQMLGRPLAWSEVEVPARRAAPSSPSLGVPDGPATARRPPPPKRSNTLPFAAGAQRWPSWLPRPEGDASPPQPSPSVSTTIDTPIAREEIDAAIARAEAARAASAGPSWFHAPSPSQPEIVLPAPVIAPPAPVIAPPAPVIAPPAEAGVPQPAARPFLSLSSPMPMPMPSPSALSPSPSPLPSPTPPVSALKPLGSPLVTPRRPPASAPSHDAAARGVAAASNAAAASAAVASESATPAEAKPARQPATPREPAREHVDLIWFDPDAVARIRADRVLGEAPEKRPPVVWITGDAQPREPEEARQRRDVLAVMSRVTPLDEAGVARAAGDAYHDDGTFTAPLVLIGGELALAFDEIEALRATITVVSPFVGTDKKLRDTVDGATEALKSPWPLPADIAEGFTRRVEEAFAQGQRAVAPGYLETSVEKILLQGRKYQKKTLFGEPRIRALLSFGGSLAPIPAYLPEPIGPKLPLFRRFKTRAIVEIRPQEDQYESNADALLVIALARIVRRAGS